MNISNEELYMINGGLVKKGAMYAAFTAIGGLVALLVGIVDGYINPLKCNK